MNQQPDSLKKEIRAAYSGILSEEQIEQTIQWWNKFDRKARIEGAIEALENLKVAKRVSSFGDVVTDNIIKEMLADLKKERQKGNNEL